jgi:L-amino acid N-acyltransferase YncA
VALTGLEIRPARAEDRDAIWEIFREVVSRGDTYAYPPDTSRDEAMALWFPSGALTCVGVDSGEIVATYLLKANQPGQGDHVANCGYMVARRASGRGIGEALCRHSLDEARRLGFRAMQFNFVVSSNASAVRLWQKCGFTIVGTLPQAFRHPSLGLVDCYVMHRTL